MLQALVNTLFTITFNFLLILFVSRLYDQTKLPIPRC
jgi:hypothetical protein